MNRLFAILTDNNNTGLLQRALEQPGGPTLPWLAQSNDQSWLMPAIERLGPWGTALHEARLPKIDTDTWNAGEPAVMSDGMVSGAWMNFVQHGNSGLLIPDDSSKEPFWTVCLPASGGWLPVQLVFGDKQHSIRQARTTGRCTLGKDAATCTPLDTDCQCELRATAGKYPRRECHCVGHAFR